MPELFNIKRGDTSPQIRWAIDPLTVDLTGATVLFKMKVTGGTTALINAAGVVLTATGTPTIGYTWQTGDTATKGFYDAEFEVTYLSGKKETFPNTDFISVRVSEDII